MTANKRSFMTSASKTMYREITSCAGWSGGMLDWLMQRGIEPHIPVIDRNHQTDGMFTHRDFTFDRDRDLFVCPGGKELTFACDRGNGILTYRARKVDCRNCALRSQCTTGGSRVLSISAFEETHRHVADLSTTEAFKTSARLRRKVEMLFAISNVILTSDACGYAGSQAHETNAF